MRSKWLLVVVALGVMAPVAWATSYASGITSLGGGDYSFVLNQDATNVVIQRPGDTPLVLGALSKGTHTFNVGAGTGYEIRVYSSAAPGWSQISVDSTPTSFYSPAGISVNKYAGSANFGRLYVSNAVAGTTAFGRVSQDGIYSLQADMVDTGFHTGGWDWAGSSGPFKSTIGPDGHLYVADFSDDLVVEFSADMATATGLIDATNKTTNQWVESIYVQGTQAAGNRKIYLVNSNYNDNDRKGLIQYDLSGNATATPGDTGMQYIGPSYFEFYPRDVARDSNGDWYMCQFRFDPTQAPAISKFLDGPPPINTAAWETPLAAPYNGAYGIDIFEPEGWVAYGNYYDGWVHIFDMDDGSYVGGFDAGSRVRDVAFDAAGNLYTVDNLTEWLRVWSPGGDYAAITSSNGTFYLVPEPAGLILLVVGGLMLRRRR